MLEYKNVRRENKGQGQDVVRQHMGGLTKASAFKAALISMGSLSPLPLTACEYWRAFTTDTRTESLRVWRLLG